MLNHNNKVEVSKVPTSLHFLHNIYTFWITYFLVVVGDGLVSDIVFQILLQTYYYIKLTYSVKSELCVLCTF